MHSRDWEEAHRVDVEKEFGVQKQTGGERLRPKVQSESHGGSVRRDTTAGTCEILVNQRSGELQEGTFSQCHADRHWERAPVRSE